MEILDVVDENGNPTGETVERTEAHKTGVRHRTSHVWVVRKNNGSMEILLQKRSKNKDSHPGCLDCSSAGHIPAGVDFIPSAIRELKEELGIDANENEFVYCGKTVGKRTNVFYGETFIDNQVSNIYYIERNMEADKFNIQKEELESVVWMKYDDVVFMVENNTIPNCIKMEELEMLGKKINK